MCLADLCYAVDVCVCRGCMTIALLSWRHRFPSLLVDSCFFIVKPMENQLFCLRIGVGFEVVLGVVLGPVLGSVLGSILGPFQDAFWSFFGIILEPFLFNVPR